MVLEVDKNRINKYEYKVIVEALRQLKVKLAEKKVDIGFIMKQTNIDERPFRIVLKDNNGFEMNRDMTYTKTSKYLFEQPVSLSNLEAFVEQAT